MSVETAKAWRANNRGRLRTLDHARRSNPKDRIRTLVSQANARSKEKLYDFDRSIFHYLMSTDISHCACCAATLDYSTGMGTGNRRMNGPSIDRIDNDGGYVPDNVALICMACNTRKSTSSAADLEKILHYTRTRSGKETEPWIPRLL